MIELIKKTCFYIIFLKIRVIFFDNNKLTSQLLKRAHLLDKLNQESKSITYITKEVEICLNQISKKKIEINDSIKWAIEILQEAKFGKIETESKKIEFTETNLINLENLIKSRRSVRKWSKDEVDNELIIKAIDCAQWAPSSCNRQAWYFLVLSRKGDFNVLKKITNQSFFENANKLIVCFVDMQNYSTSEYSYAFLDMGASIQNLLLELHNLNLGACQFGIKQTQNNKNFFKVIQDKFNLSKTMIPVSFIAVGNYIHETKAPGRKKIDDVCECD